MKNIYDNFRHGLQAWPNLRGVLVFGLIISFSEVIVLALIHQCTGTIPSTQNINLLLWHWHLPFNISRLWDITLLPLFVYLSFKNEEHRENKAFDEFPSGDYGASVIDITQICLYGSMLGSSIFGVIYVLPMFVATYLLWFLFSLLFLLFLLAEKAINSLTKKSNKASDSSR